MNFQPAGILTLSSDFGGLGPYEGQMRGAALSAAPEVRVFDLWHGVPAQGVRLGAFLLPRLWPTFPPGTVHAAVVDPGVGTERAALVLSWRDFLLVGPDNGLFTLPLREGGEVRLLDPKKHGRPDLSFTFHGRDLFAPAGARLAAGLLEWETLEPFPGRPVEADLPGAEVLPGGEIRGEVVLADPFGNLVTSIPSRLLPGPGARGGGRVEILGREIPVLETYGQAEPGALLALTGSFGLLEIARRDGSAREGLGAAEGTEVRFFPGF